MNPTNYQKILTQLEPYEAKLVVVSKFRTFEEIANVYSWGHRIFGENRVQELASKKNLHGLDCEWHLIGSLQKNKVKSVVQKAALIHSVDSLSLLNEINKQAEKLNYVQECLLQCKIASEITKQGLSLSELAELLESKEFEEFKNIRIKGVMGMATNTDDVPLVRTEFKSLRKIYEELKATYFKENTYFKEMSAGMSDDYQIALEEGSTLLRIGSLIFND